MSVLIANLPKASNLDSNHLVIVEKQQQEESNGTMVLKSLETQKTTLQDIYNWLNSSGNTYNIKPSQIQILGTNLTRTVSDNTVTIKYNVSEWVDEDPETNIKKLYTVGDLVYYQGCLYICYQNTTEHTGAPANNEFWYQVGYKPGKYLTLAEDNTLNASGIEVWDENKTYTINDFVIYNKKLYRCKEANQSGVWTEDNWENIGEGNGIIPYKTGKYYEAGSIVLYEGRLYRKLEDGTPSGWAENQWQCISNGDFANVYIKYSHTVPSSNNDLKNIPDEYMGIYVGSSRTQPTNYDQYTWYKIKGENGYVNVDANVVVISMTLLVDDWEGESAPYSQTKQNINLTADMYPIMDIAYSNNSEDWADEKLQYSYITRAVCNNGSITFYCGETKPERDINLKLRINGDVNAESFVTKQEFNEFKTMVGNMNTLLETTLGGN